MSTMTVDTAPTFTAHDRCDRCGAQAHVRALFATGELLFCSHHGREYAAPMAATLLALVEEAPVS